MYLEYHTDGTDLTIGMVVTVPSVWFPQYHTYGISGTIRMVFHRPSGRYPACDPLALLSCKNHKILCLYC